MSDRSTITHIYFRDKALKEAVSPDDLDHLTSLTQPVSWAVLGGALLVLAGILAVVFFGSVSSVCLAQGIMFGPDRRLQISAPWAGVVSRIEVKAGDLIDKGSVVAVVSHLGTDSQETPLLSPARCRIEEVRVPLGASVLPGTPLFSGSPASPSNLFQVCGFLDLTRARRIRPGMAVRVMPSVVRREQTGYIRGQIRHVADLPITPEGLEALVGSKELAEELLGQGPLVPVYLELEPDTAAINGLAWSSPKGREVALASNTLCTIEIVLDSQAPIHMLFPLIRGRHD